MIKEQFNYHSDLKICYLAKPPQVPDVGFSSTVMTNLDLMNYKALYFEEIVERFYGHVFITMGLSFALFSFTLPFVFYYLDTVNILLAMGLIGNNLSF